MYYCSICKKVKSTNDKCCVHEKYMIEVPKEKEIKCLKCSSTENLRYTKPFGPNDKFGNYFLCEKHEKRLTNSYKARCQDYVYLLIEEGECSEELMSKEEVQERLEEIVRDSDYDYKENCMENIIVLRLTELDPSEITPKKIEERNSHLCFFDSSVYYVEECIKPYVDLSLDESVYL